MWDTRRAWDMTPFVQSYMARHASEILTASRATGVPAEAIAAAIAEEMMENIYGYAEFRTFPNWVEDIYVTAGSALSRGWLSKTWSRVRSLVEKDELPKKYVDKVKDPLADDIGPANFNLGNAIRLVNKSLGDARAEALDLRRYADGNYHALAKDLVDLNSPATVNLVAYYLQEGKAFLERTFGSSWTAASSQGSGSMAGYLL